MPWTTLPVRIPRLLLGSLTPTNSASATVTAGPGQLAPRSEERITAMLTRGFVELFCEMTIKELTRVWSGRTTIWFETVCASGPGS